MPLLLAAALLTIRIYNYAGVSPAELAAARANADGIFQDAGMSLQWVNCRVPNSMEGDACREPLHDSGEFVLRLQTASNQNTPPHVALGSSLIDTRSGSGVLITIDPRLVSTVAAQAAADPALVLGRAIAHELGHLLIGMPGHSTHGLMRALWSQRELRGNSAADWQFSADQAELMRWALAKGVRVAGAGNSMRITREPGN